MRAVNAIPVVCAAQPGMYSPLDLPLITGRDTIRHTKTEALMRDLRVALCGMGDVGHYAIRGFSADPT